MQGGREKERCEGVETERKERREGGGGVTEEYLVAKAHTLKIDLSAGGESPKSSPWLCYSTLHPQEKEPWRRWQRRWTSV